MKIKSWIIPYCYCLFISLIFLLICSKNSPLYYINDWVDANAFFTVGKAMVRGYVPYKMLFEQKGPLLYLIYGIGSMISYNSFIGVFILEVVSFSIFLYYSYKLMCIFTSEKNAYFMIPIYTLLIVTLKSFSHGGSAEEFSLPFIMYTMYIFIRYLHDSVISIKQIFITGILAGCVFWIKYTLLGFFIGYMLCLVISLLTYKKYKDIFKYCFIFLFGFILVSIPWVIYFIVNDAFSDMIDVYFLVNIVAYPHKTSIISKLLKTLELVMYNLSSNPAYFIFIVIGSISLFFSNDKWKTKNYKILLFTLIALTGAGAYIGGTNFHYYSLVLCPFIIIGIVRLFKNLKINKYMILILLPLEVLSAFYTSTNTRMLKYDKEYYAQYQFARIIKKIENPKIINYGFLDGGFYLTTGVIPDCYYFMKNNISYQNFPQMLDGQYEYVKNNKPDFVIIKGNAVVGRLKCLLDKNYELVNTHEQEYQQKQVTYRLYRIINK